jgi:hypothetical protein
VATAYLYQDRESVKQKNTSGGGIDKIVDGKDPSGLEVSLPVFPLKIASLDVGQTQRLSINREIPGVAVKNSETRSFNNQKEERHERRSFQR